MNVKRKYKKAANGVVIGNPPDTLFVSNPNDTRLLAYKDSLYAYNKQMGNLEVRGKETKKWRNSESEKEYNKLSKKRKQMWSMTKEDQIRVYGSQEKFSADFKALLERFYYLEDQERYTTYTATPIYKDIFPTEQKARAYKIRNISPVNIKKEEKSEFFYTENILLPTTENKYGKVFSRYDFNKRAELTKLQKQIIIENYKNYLLDAFPDYKNEIEWQEYKTEEFIKWLNTPYMPAQTYTESRYYGYIPIFQKPTRVVELTKMRPPLIKEILSVQKKTPSIKVASQPTYIQKGEHTIPDTQYANVKLVYDKDNKLIARMNSKGERIPYDPTAKNLTKDFVYPKLKEGGIIQNRWKILKKAQNGGQQLFPVPELQSSKQDNTKAPAYLNDMPKSIEERIARDKMIEDARLKQLAEKEAELKRHYARTDVVSGMNTKPSDKGITQLAQQSIDYNKQLKDNPVGTLGPDIAMSVIPELLMMKGPSQAINKVGKFFNPFKESSPWKNKFRLINKFIPDENAYYRMLGDEEGLKDVIESRLLRPNQNGSFKDRNAWYSKGKPIDKQNRLVDTKALNGTYYKGKYMAEVKQGDKFPEDATNLPQWNFGKTKPGQHISIDEPNVTLYKKDWLTGYKQIKVPKNINTETQNLGFNPDILSNTLWHGYLPKVLPDELPKGGYFRKIGNSKGERIPYDPTAKNLTKDFVYPKLKEGGIIQKNNTTMKSIEKPPFDEWYKTVPQDKNDTINYRLSRAYELAPQEQLDAFAKNPKAHLNTAYINKQTGNYEFMKSKNHPTIKNELDWYNSKEANKFREQYELYDDGTDYYQYRRKLKNGLNYGFEPGGKWQIEQNIQGPSHEQGGIPMRIYKQNVEVEGGELAIKNSHGDIAIIPIKEKRNLILNMQNGNNMAIDEMVSKLPKITERAEEGLVVDEPPSSLPAGIQPSDTIGIGATSEQIYEAGPVNVALKDKTNIGRSALPGIGALYGGAVGLKVLQDAINKKIGYKGGNIIGTSTLNPLKASPTTIIKRGYKDLSKTKDLKEIPTIKVYSDAIIEQSPKGSKNILQAKEAVAKVNKSFIESKNKRSYIKPVITPIEEVKSSIKGQELLKSAEQLERIAAKTGKPPIVTKSGGRKYVQKAGIGINELGHTVALGLAVDTYGKYVDIVDKLYGNNISSDKKIKPDLMYDEFGNEVPFEETKIKGISGIKNKPIAKKAATRTRVYKK